MLELLTNKRIQGQLIHVTSPSPRGTPSGCGCSFSSRYQSPTRWHVRCARRAPSPCSDAWVVGREADCRPFPPTWEACGASRRIRALRAIDRSRSRSWSSRLGECWIGGHGGFELRQVHSRFPDCEDGGAARLVMGCGGTIPDVTHSLTGCGAFVLTCPSGVVGPGPVGACWPDQELDRGVFAHASCPVTVLP